MKKNITIEFSFLFILLIYSIIITKCHTISLGLIPLFCGLYSFKIPQIKIINNKTLAIVLLLFIIVFSINFLAVFNFETYQLKVPHPDFSLYLKIASYFNQIGIENNLTAKTVLFDKVNFATPYRFFDTWLLALLIKVLPYSDLQVLQLFYLPLLWFMVTFSIYRNVDFVKNNSVKILLSISFLFLFGDYLTNFFILKAPIGELCVVSYPKLAIFFCSFIYYFKQQLNNNNSKHDSILFLAFLPILIQTTFPIYLFIYSYLIINYKYFLENKKIVIAIVFSSIYFLGFYGYNFYLAKEIFQVGQFQFVKSFPEYFHRLASILFNLVKAKLLLFIIISLIFVFVADYNRKKIYLRMLSIAMAIIISGAIIYAFFPSSPNSYQLMTNLIFPVNITFLFFIWVDGLSIATNKVYLLNCSMIFILALFGAYNQYNEMGFFNVKNVFTNVNNEYFVQQSQQVLRNSKNPIGITYWSKKNENRSNMEHFDQFGTDFLVRLGANFDVVCLSALHKKEDSYADKVFKHYSAIGIYQRIEHKSIVNLESDFYHRYKFEFLISDEAVQFLPDYIKKDVINVVFDTKSKIYLYSLKRKNNNSLKVN